MTRESFHTQAKDIFTDWLARLMSERERLENCKKSLNPIKLISKYRSVRLLAVAGKNLWRQVVVWTSFDCCQIPHVSGFQTVSERMRRELLSLNEEDLQPINGLFRWSRFCLGSQLD